MTDVPIYVALITGLTGAIGAATPQIATVFRDTSQAKRDRKERGVNARQQACVDLLGAAADLRTRVENTAMYGGEILARLAEIRSSAADVQVKAARVAFLAGEMATSAQALASAATDLATAAVQNTDMTTNVMSSPDFTAFGKAVEQFKSEAISNADK
jgi:hypothetical protein